MTIEKLRLIYGHNCIIVGQYVISETTLGVFGVYNFETSGEFTECFDDPYEALDFCLTLND